MKENLAFIFRTAGMLLLLTLFQGPLMQFYGSVLLEVIAFFPSSRLIPDGVLYNSSAHLLITLALLLTIPGLPRRRSIQLIVGSVSVYLLLDFFSFLLWIAPPEPHGNTPGAHLLYTRIWALLGQWLLPLAIWNFAAYPWITALLAKLTPQKATGLKHS